MQLCPFPHRDADSSIPALTSMLMNFLQPSGLQMGWGRGWGRWKSRVVPGRVTHLPYFNLPHLVMKCFIYKRGTEEERLGRRRTAWRGEALDVPVAASIGFCILQYFLGCEHPLSWVIHCISVVKGFWEAHLPPFFCSSGNAIQWYVLHLIFPPKTVVCGTCTLSVYFQSAWGWQPQQMPGCCLWLSPPGKVWADPIGLFIVSSQTVPWKNVSPTAWPRLTRNAQD